MLSVNDVKPLATAFQLPSHHSKASAKSPF